ncbi:DUF6126 family protein [Streptomyces sp. NPDC020742]|uniref:DUF6126 family protein n=1 Tax=Streptomyces sp. NPDC020742 TaxID=3154897 RepID=UPI00340B1C88
MPDRATPPPTDPAADSPGSPGPLSEPVRSQPYVVTKPPRGVSVRVFIYVVATHVLLAFMSMLVFLAKSR